MLLPKTPAGLSVREQLFLPTDCEWSLIFKLGHTYKGLHRLFRGGSCMHSFGDYFTALTVLRTYCCSARYRRVQAELMWSYWLFLLRGMWRMCCKTLPDTEVIHRRIYCCLVSVFLGSVCPLSAQGWSHSIYCLLHLWKHMCSLQVKVKPGRIFL